MSARPSGVRVRPRTCGRSGMPPVSSDPAGRWRLRAPVHAPRRWDRAPPRREAPKERQETWKLTTVTRRRSRCQHKMTADVPCFAPAWRRKRNGPRLRESAWIVGPAHCKARQEGAGREKMSEPGQRKQREIRMKLFERVTGLRGTLPVILSAILLTVAFSVLTQAHAKLEKTVPADKAALTAAPTSLQLFFSERPDATVSKIELKGPSGMVKLG